MSIISINNLTKDYKTTRALNGVSLEIEQGKLYGLLGVNGAGKTTLIKILCGLTKKTSGTAIVDGLNLDNDIDKILNAEKFYNYCLGFNIYPYMPKNKERKLYSN